jgi:hypothetical protein
MAVTAAAGRNVGSLSVKPGTKNAAEKRRKEIDRLKWQKLKAEKRQQRQSEKDARALLNPDEDPDLIGIVPGPQPIPEAEPPTTGEPPAETLATDEAKPREP